MFKSDFLFQLSCKIRGLLFVLILKSSDRIRIMNHHDEPIKSALFPPGPLPPLPLHNGGAQVLKKEAADKFSVFRSISNVFLIIAASIGEICNNRANYLYVCTHHSHFIHYFGPPTMPRTKASPKKCVKSQVANNTLLLILKGKLYPLDYSAYFA